MPVEDKKLDSIFKTSLVEDKAASEIQIIWEEYHKGKEVIAATIPLEVYDVIRHNMHQFPTFLFPLPRSQGYEFILCQVYGHTVHFTPLLAFQVCTKNIVFYWHKNEMCNLQGLYILLQQAHPVGQGYDLYVMLC